MALLDGDRLTQLAFSVFQNKGVYALLLGSGLSRAAEIPTGWDITLDLVRRVALAKGEGEQADWAAWYRQRAGSEPNYSDVLAELALSPDERRAILHGYIEPTEQDREAGRKTPTRAHRAIAQMVAGGYIRVIITTNFDRLLETALRERGIEPTVVSSVDALRGAEPLTHTTCYILKLHGDYKDARILNTDEELAAYPVEYDDLLDRIFDEHGLIVAGWSGVWDHALRAAFLRAKSRRYSMFWAARGSVEDPAREIIAHRRGVVLEIADADSFFVGLEERAETLRQTGRQNPLSVELIVASAKRYLGKPEHRIQLDDLIGGVGADWLARIPSDRVGHGPVDATWWLARAKQHEAATEAVAKMCMVLGRWGDDGEFQAVVDLVAMQMAQAGAISEAFVALNGLRSYPAVLVVTAYALGLIRAGRWRTLHRLFTTELSKREEKKRFVDVLFNTSWEGTADDMWKRIPGYEKRMTAFAEMQCDLLKRWSASVLGLVPDFELLYERFELLGAFAHFEKHELSDGEGGVVRSSGDWVWMPIGRVIWDSQRRNKLVAELQPGDTLKSYLSAGFGRGNSRYAELFLQDFGRVASGHW